MITNILKLAEIFSKFTKIKQMIDFFRKNIPPYIHIPILYIFVVFLLVDKQALQRRVERLEKANRISVLRNVGRFSSGKIKTQAIEKAKATNKIFYIYQDIDVFDNKDKVKNITILRNLFCENGKDGACFENLQLKKSLEILKQPRYDNDTKEWFRMSNKKKINLIDGEDVYVYCGVFELKANTEIGEILNAIKPSKKMFGFGCRFEDTHGVGFMSETNLSLNFATVEYFFNSQFQEFFDIWKAQYEYEMKMQRKKEKVDLQ